MKDEKSIKIISCERPQGTSTHVIQALLNEKNNIKEELEEIKIENDYLLKQLEERKNENKDLITIINGLVTFINSL